MSSLPPQSTKGTFSPADRDRRLRHLRQLGDVLLDTAEPIERLRAACADLEEILTGIHGVPSAVIAEEQRYRHASDHGEVISPGYAISTMQDAMRTAKFFRALVAAIQQMQKNHPGERIHILYPGPGPNAPFFVLAAARFRATEIGFTMIEYMHESWEAAHHLSTALGMTEYAHALLNSDAVMYRHAGSPIHILIAEIMQQALRGEPQFAIFKNLVPQLEPDAIVIPHKIEIRAGLTDPHRELDHVRTYPLPAEATALRQDLGPMLELSKAALLERYHKEPRRYLRATDWSVPDFKIPPLLNSARTFTIFTRIYVSTEIELKEGESGLTIPVYDRSLPTVQAGDEIKCKYLLGSKPGLQYELNRPRMRIIKD